MRQTGVDHVDIIRMMYTHTGPHANARMQVHRGFGSRLSYFLGDLLTWLERPVVCETGGLVGWFWMGVCLGKQIN